MAKAIVLVKSVSITDGNLAQVKYDMVIDQGGYQFNDLICNVTIANSTTQTNNAIRSNAVTQAAGTVALVSGDITIFGGAQ